MIFCVHNVVAVAAVVVIMAVIVVAAAAVDWCWNPLHALAYLWRYVYL